ncbi:MAG: hypothetical protein AAF202_00095 [Pseudomonadota bacterium]
MNWKSLLWPLAVVACLHFDAALGELTTDVKWYEPVVEPLGDSMVAVYVSGQVKPNIKFKVDRENIRFFKGKKAQKMEPIEDEGGEFVWETESNGAGAFGLKIPLPLGKVLLPIEISEGDQKKSFVLVFEAQPGSVAIAGANSVLQESPIFRSKLRLWVGVGMNYLSLAQDESGVIEDINFNSLDGPVLLYEVSYHMTPKVEGILTYKSTVGQTKSSDSITIQQNVYSWQTVTGEIKHLPDSWKFNVGKRLLSVGYRAGFQYHLIPYLGRESGSSTLLFVRDTEVYQASAGPVLHLRASRNWSMEIFMRVQSLLGSSAGLDLENSFSFDGSVGITRKVFNKVFLGLFWYGQYISTDYTQREKFLDQRTSGELELLYSNLELRFGVGF